MRFYAVLSLAAFVMLTAAVALPAQADAPLDTPTVTLAGSSRTSLILQIQAGPSGAPGGVWIDWMTAADHAAGGWTGNIVYCSLNGTPTLNTTWGTESFVLGPDGIAQAEIGDLFDETGLWATSRDELEAGSEYVFRVWANASGASPQSPISGDLYFSTQAAPPQNCTYTQGYWKTHPLAWPVGSLMLGSVNYTAAELQSILGTAAAGNGLIFLAHQLIAAKLNVAMGAVPPLSIQNAIANADALIGSLVVPPVGAGYLTPASASSLTQTLDEFNNGITGPGHCGSTPVETTTWSAIKAQY